MNIDVENMLPILDIEELDQDLQDKIKPEEIIEPETEPSTPPVEETEEPINENDPPQESEKETGDNQLSTAFFNELAERGIALTQEGKEEYRDIAFAYAFASMKKLLMRLILLEC